MNAQAMEILNLLKARNRCLQRVLELCTRFSAEWDVAAAERDPLLARFQTQRESLFRGLELYERQAATALAALPAASREPALIAEARQAFAARDRLVAAILELDREITQRLEADKSRLLDEITGARRGQSLLNKFKSAWVTASGEGLDQKL